MNGKIDELLEGLRALEEEFEAELERRRSEFHYRIEHGRVAFERQALVYQRTVKTGLLRFLSESSLRNVLSSPVIYAQIVPIVLLDLFVSLFQWSCFPLYRIAQVRRGDYLVVDRGSLAYLNAIEKLNCVYCGYSNGVLAYAREVAARVEQYWCPIKHARRPRGSHAHSYRFVDYGDADGYRARLAELRAALRALDH